MTRSERYTDRTCKLINAGRIIVLKRKSDGCYLHQWTLIQAGIDKAVWSKHHKLAMEMFSLEWAFAIAKLYKCKVFSRKL